MTKNTAIFSIVVLKVKLDNFDIDFFYLLPSISFYEPKISEVQKSPNLAKNFESCIKGQMLGTSKQNILELQFTKFKIKYNF